MVEGGEELKEEEETFHPDPEKIKNLFLWFLWAIYGLVTITDIITISAALSQYPLFAKIGEIPGLIIAGCLAVWWPLTLIYLFAVLKGTPNYAPNNEFANGFLFGYFLSRWWK